MIQALEHGNYYHIYNRGINSTKLFNEKENYKHFLNLYDIHINPIADNYAWCLMKNHFHFLVRIKEVEEIHVEKKFYHLNLFQIYLMLTPKPIIKDTFDMELYLKDHLEENKLMLMPIYKM